MAIDAKQEIQSQMIPFLGSLQERIVTGGGSTPYTDQYFLNGNFWEMENKPLGKKTFQWVSRPGYIRQYTNTSGVTSGSVAMYSWRGSVYSYTGTQLLKNGVSIGTIPAPTSVGAQFTETRPGATTPYLCLNNGDYLILVNASDEIIILSDIAITTVAVGNPSTVTTATPHGLTSGVRVVLRDVSGSTPDVNGTIYVATVTGASTFTIPVNVTVQGTGGTLGNFPSDNLGVLVYMDSYIFTMLSTGEIYNCAADDPTSWDPTWFLTAQMYPGSWRALARQNNFMVAFSDTTIQTFVTRTPDAVGGSPLENYESGAQQVGCVRASSIATDGQHITWVGTTKTGQNTVYMMRGLTVPQEIATIQIKNLMSSNYGNSRCFFIRSAGKNLYIMTSGSVPEVLVYDYNLEMWIIWKRAVNTVPAEWIAFSGYRDGGLGPASEVLFLLEGSGDIYRFTPDETTDRNTTVTSGGGTAFEVAIQTERIDFGTMVRKYMRRLELLADKTATTTNVLVSYSDDDYNTFTSTRTLDLSQDHTFLPLGGNFRRRAYKFSYTGTNRIRWQGFELYFRFGTN